MPLQSLALLNSSFARLRAAAFARRLERDEPDAEKRLTRAFRLAYGRAPGDNELTASRRFQQARRLRAIGSMF